MNTRVITATLTSILAIVPPLHARCPAGPCAPIDIGACQDGDLEDRQQQLEEPDAAQQRLEQPNSAIIDGQGAVQRQYDAEQPDARQQDLERPRYEYDD